MPVPCDGAAGWVNAECASLAAQGGIGASRPGWGPFGRPELGSIGYKCGDEISAVHLTLSCLL